MENKQIESIYYKAFRLLERPLTDSERSLSQSYLKYLKEEIERLEAGSGMTRADIHDIATNNVKGIAIVTDPKEDLLKK